MNGHDQRTYSRLETKRSAGARSAGPNPINTGIAGENLARNHYWRASCSEKMRMARARGSVRVPHARGSHIRDVRRDGAGPLTRLSRAVSTLWHYRDKQQRGVDVVLELGSGEIASVEITTAAPSNTAGCCPMAYSPKRRNIFERSHLANQLNARPV